MELLLWLARTDGIADDAVRAPPHVAEARAAARSRALAPIGLPRGDESAAAAPSTTSPWCQLEDNDAASLLQVWSFLRTAAAPLGLDSTMQTRGDDVPRLTPRHLVEAVAAAAPSPAQDALLSGVGVALVRAILGALPAVLAATGLGGEVEYTTAAQLREMAAAAVDADTWTEYARRALVAVAQASTAEAAWGRLGTAMEQEVADAEAAGQPPPFAVDTNDPGWVHLQRGGAAFEWLLAAEIRPAGAGDDTAAAAASGGSGRGGVLPPPDALDVRTRHYAESLAHPFAAYEYARTLRALDTAGVRTFPVVHHAAATSIAAPLPSLAAPPYDAATLAAAAADAPPPGLFPDAGSPPPGGCATTIPPSLPALAVAAPAADAVAISAGGGPYPSLATYIAAAHSRADDGARAIPWRLALLSLRGVGTRDTVDDHAYLYGTVQEAARGVAVELAALGDDDPDAETEDEDDGAAITNGGGVPAAGGGAAAAATAAAAGSGKASRRGIAVRRLARWTPC